jgi:glycosyltransferase involved in cell wall biosynthesis
MSDSKKDDAPRRWWKEWLKARLVRRFDSALVAGDPHRDYVNELGVNRERIFLGYDVVDNDYFRRETADIRREADRWRSEWELPAHYFLVVSRFLERKNLSRLLDAYAAYQERSTDPWDLVIAGGGPREDILHEKAASLGLAGVHWPGFVQLQELPRYYGLASCLVMPSTVDQWGLVVNEAMASGLPVLVSRTAGCRYNLVQEGANGYLFDPFSTPDMARALERMAALPLSERQAMGQQSRAIIDRWNPDRFARGLWQAIQTGRGEPVPETPG